MSMHDIGEKGLSWEAQAVYDDINRLSAVTAANSVPLTSGQIKEIEMVKDKLWSFVGHDQQVAAIASLLGLPRTADIKDVINHYVLRLFPHLERPIAQHTEALRDMADATIETMRDHGIYAATTGSFGAYAAARTPYSDCDIFVVPPLNESDALMAALDDLDRKGFVGFSGEENGAKDSFQELRDNDGFAFARFLSTDGNSRGTTLELFGFGMLPIYELLGQDPMEWRVKRHRPSRRKTSVIDLTESPYSSIVVDQPNHEDYYQCFYDSGRPILGYPARLLTQLDGTFNHYDPSGMLFAAKSQVLKTARDIITRQHGWMSDDDMTTHLMRAFRFMNEASCSEERMRTLQTQVKNHAFSTT